MLDRDEILKLTTIINTLVENKEIPEESKGALISQISQIGTPLSSDPWVYRMVVIFLGLTVVGTVFGGFLMQYRAAVSIPEGLIALGSAAIGALAGLLAPSPAKK